MNSRTETYQDGKHVVCPKGHIHHYQDLDKHGLDYFCPECFSGVETAQVDRARRKENEIDPRYFEEEDADE